MTKKKKERAIKEDIALASIERVQLNRELQVIRKNKKKTKEMKKRMSEIFTRTKELDYELADQYYILRETQLKIYGE